MSKSKPIGVRIKEDKLKFIMDRESLTTVQQVVTFLIDRYWWENNLTLGARHVTQPVSESVINSGSITNKPPFQETIEEPYKATRSYDLLKEGIAAATSSAELEKAWREVSKNKDLASWQMRELTRLKDAQQTKVDF